MELELRDYIIIFMVIIIVYLFFKKYIEKFTDPTTTASSITQQVADQIDDVFKADLSKLNDLGNLLNILNTNPDTKNDLSAKDITVNELKPDNIICQNIQVNGNITIEDINNFENKTFNIYPRYMVMIWTQTIIPKGWVLCDGKTWYVNKIKSVTYDELNKLAQNANVTIDNYIKDNNYETIVVPNLIDKFVLGAINDNTRDKYTLHNTGGAESVILGDFDLPRHYHGLPFVINSRNDYDPNNPSADHRRYPQMAGDNNPHPENNKDNYMGSGFYIVPRGSDTSGYSGDFVNTNGILTKGKTYTQYPAHNYFNAFTFYWYIIARKSNGLIQFASPGYAIETDYARSPDVKPSKTNKGHNNMPPYYNLCYIMKL